MIIGIIGYGKMGQAVEKQSLTRGHSFILLSSLDPLRSHGFDAVDCVIDFSHADVAENAITACLKAGKPVVSGTTGWNDGVRSLGALCEELEGAFCWSPNFSIGMQITFHLNRTLAKIMNDMADYTPEILEVHHTDKKDAPSGTAIALANDILSNIDRLSEWELTEKSDGAHDFVPVVSVRESDIKGIHRVMYKSTIDTISIRHHALSREGFAQGAIVAAEKLLDKTGFYAFKDLLHLSGTS